MRLNLPRKGRLATNITTLFRNFETSNEHGYE